MDLEGRRRPRFMSKQPCVYCLSVCFLSACALLCTFSATNTLCFGNRGSTRYRWTIDCFTDNQGRGGGITSNTEAAAAESFAERIIRRCLSGPGSSPPRCTSKCGKCSPCKPVHVPVPPGTPVTTEYYPEAWRCKCGNKLYMP